MTDSPESQTALSRRWRVAGTVALVLGIAGAITLYLVRTRSGDVTDDPMLTNYSRASDHQMEVLYGRMGTMMTDLMEDLKRPGVQAVLIGLGGVMIAWGCFVVAERMEEGEEGGTSNIEH